MHIAATRATAAAMTLTAALALAACSSGSSSAPSESAAAGSVNLSGICPSTIVLQTDWNPEAEHGGLYDLLGKDYTINKAKKSVSGPLLDNGKPTGVNVEIRSGGPAIGFQTVTSQLYSDPSIMLGYVNSDEAIQNSGKQPSLAVMAPLIKSPQMIMWDPKTYPNVSSIADLGKALPAQHGVVRYFEGTSYMTYLIDKGFLPKSVTDGSYDGTPANFVAAGGKDAQQGYSTAEPYTYEHEIKAWSKPVKFQLIHDTGYPIYQGTMAGKPDTIKKYSTCLKKFVPIMQQAQVNFLKSPDASVNLILQLVHAYNNGWVYSKGVADYAVKTMKSEGIVANDAKGTLGAFDDARMKKIITLVEPIFKKAKTHPKADLQPSDIVTNEFIDPSIGL